MPTNVIIFVEKGHTFAPFAIGEELMCLWVSVYRNDALACEKEGFSRKSTIVSHRIGILVGRAAARE